MKKRDRKNLKFLLALDESGLKAWYDQATEDDIEYASELLATAMLASKSKQSTAMRHTHEAPRSLQ